MSDDRMLELLVAVGRGDASGEPMSNRLLAECLGWSADEVADRLGQAREQLLIWGLPGYGNPRPQFEQLELTVQGRRAIESHSHATRDRSELQG